MGKPLASGADFGVQPDGMMDAEARVVPVEHLRDERLSHNENPESVLPIGARLRPLM